MSFITLQVTGKCNLKCPFCLDEYKHEDHMTMDAFLNALAYIKDNKITKVHLTGGEPLTHPLIKKFIQILKANDLNIILYTNGLLLDGYKDILFDIDEYHISIDSYEFTTRGRSNFNMLEPILKYLETIEANVFINSVVTAKNMNLISLGDKLSTYSFKWNLRRYVNTGSNDEDFIIAKTDFFHIYNELKALYKDLVIKAQDSEKGLTYRHITPTSNVVFYNLGLIDRVVYF